MTTDSKRNYQHVDFDQTTCPVDGCTAGKGGVPQTGSVPGIKRHVKLVHGAEVFAKTEFPAIRSESGPIAKQTVTELLAAATNRGLIPEGTPAKKLTKAVLIHTLITGEKLAGKDESKEDAA